MPITLQRVNPQLTQVFMGTLTGGENIHKALEAIAQEQNISAASFELLGGLQMAEFTEYDSTTQTRKSPLRFDKPLEIAAGHGTISWLEDKPHVHFHLVCSFQDETAPNGIAIVGGHCAEAEAFAIEFTLHSYRGRAVERASNEETGLNLWRLPPH